MTKWRVFETQCTYLFFELLVLSVQCSAAFSDLATAASLYLSCPSTVINVWYPNCPSASAATEFAPESYLYVALVQYVIQSASGRLHFLT